MTYSQIEKYFNKFEEKKTDDKGSICYTFRAEPWLNFFLDFCKKHNDFCELVLTEYNIEMWFNMYGNGWSDGFVYASHFKFKE